MISNQIQICPKNVHMSYAEKKCIKRLYGPLEVVLY